VNASEITPRTPGKQLQRLRMVQAGRGMPISVARVLSQAPVIIITAGWA